MHFLFAVALGAALSDFAVAQLPPTPQGITTIKSKYNNDITISYKEPGICETTPNVKSYSGYVHLPPGTLADVDETQNYTINTFFWFFESRKDPANAPLSIWMNGGPGSSSMLGALQENGPCKVNDDSNTTYLNPWSFNNEVNMLYIDQPDQTGFSWDTLINMTLDQTEGTLTEFEGEVPKTNNTFMVGTFPSQSSSNSSNTTENAARALWHFAQVWFQEFPEYKPNNDAISIFTESYGGRYGPAFASFFEEQNMRIANHSIDETGDTFVIHLDTLGIINGCVDLLTQELASLTMAYNNTYGLQTINQTAYQQGVDNFNRPNIGCRERILNCRALAAEGDPNFTGNNDTVNEACEAADRYCVDFVESVYEQSSGRNVYDIAAINPDPFPPNYYQGYLNSAWVQAALGVPVNYTQSSNAVYEAFDSTGDWPRADVRGGYLDDLAYILDNGIKVALIYGDRDWICNWIGGENVSLNVPYNQAKEFAAAGYTNITVNSSYVGGQVRQHGNFSFSRVFQAGHEVPAYQPETAYQIFYRAIFGMDIATGTVSTNNNSSYSTTGSSTTFQVKNQDLGSPSPQCYILALDSTCTDDQYNSVLNGTALVHDYIVIDANQSHLFPGIGNSDKPSSVTTKKGGAGNLSVDWAVLGTVLVLIATTMLG